MTLNLDIEIKYQAHNAKAHWWLWSAAE